MMLGIQEKRRPNGGCWRLGKDGLMEAMEGLADRREGADWF